MKILFVLGLVTATVIGNGKQSKKEFEEFQYLEVYEDELECQADQNGGELVEPKQKNNFLGFGDGDDIYKENEQREEHQNNEQGFGYGIDLFQQDEIFEQQIHDVKGFGKGEDIYAQQEKQEEQQHNVKGFESLQGKQINKHNKNHIHAKTKGFGKGSELQNEKKNHKSNTKPKTKGFGQGVKLHRNKKQKYQPLQPYNEKLEKQQLITQNAKHNKD